MYAEARTLPLCQVWAKKTYEYNSRLYHRYYLIITSFNSFIIKSFLFNAVEISRCNLFVITTLKINCVVKEFTDEQETETEVISLNIILNTQLLYNIITYLTTNAFQFLFLTDICFDTDYFRIEVSVLLLLKPSIDRLWISNQFNDKQLNTGTKLLNAIFVLNSMYHLLN